MQTKRLNGLGWRRRWHGQPFGCRRIIFGLEREILRRVEHEANVFRNEFQFFTLKLQIVFFLCLFVLGNFNTEVARVLPAESFGQRFRESRILRVTCHHPYPRHGLQQSPMQADGSGQSQHNQKLGKPRQHERTIAAVVGVSKYVRLNIETGE